MQINEGFQEIHVSQNNIPTGIEYSIDPEIKEKKDDNGHMFLKYEVFAQSDFDDPMQVIIYPGAERIDTAQQVQSYIIIEGKELNYKKGDAGSIHDHIRFHEQSKGKIPGPIVFLSPCVKDPHDIRYGTDKFHKRNSHFLRGEYKTQRYLDLISKVLDDDVFKLKNTKKILMGCSLGAYLAIELGLIRDDIYRILALSPPSDKSGDFDNLPTNTNLDLLCVSTNTPELHQYDCRHLDEDQKEHYFGVPTTVLQIFSESGQLVQDSTSQKMFTSLMPQEIAESQFGECVIQTIIQKFRIPLTNFMVLLNHPEPGESGHDWDYWMKIFCHNLGYIAQLEDTGKQILNERIIAAQQKMFDLTRDEF